MLIYIIRHGDPVYNPDTLTEKGKLQASAIAKRLTLHGIDEVYTSPNGRARETAQPTCDLLGLEAKTEAWTSEDLAWKDFSIETDDGRRIWSFSKQNTVLLSDESKGQEWFNDATFAEVNAEKGYERIKNASDDFLMRMGYKREGAAYRIVEKNDKKIAVFCHQGFGLTWLSYLLSVPPRIFWAGFDITHSGMTIIEMKNNPDGFTAPRCLCLSDTSHIYREGLPLKYNNRLDY